MTRPIDAADDPAADGAEATTLADSDPASGTAEGVVEPVLEAVEPVLEASAGRSAAIGAVIGFFLAAIGVSVACLLAFDLEPASAVALGLFTGVWGGLGFGMMIGGVSAMSEYLDHP